MQITIVQGAFLPVPPVAGGAVEKLWSDLGKEFAERGLAVTHISRTWRGLPESDIADKVRHLRVPGFDYPKSGLLAKLMDLVYAIRCISKIEPCDVVVTNTFFLPVILSMLPRSARGRVIYVSAHRFPKRQMFLYRGVDRIQCVSSTVANAAIQQTPSVAHLVKVVPNYIAKAASGEEVDSSWHLRDRTILFVGRLHPEKGVQLLIRAMGLLAASLREGWKLRIVGPHLAKSGGGGEEYLESLKALASEVDVRAEWVGPIFDRDALNAEYKRASIFVYPSTAAFGEAFPLAPLEALAMGCPTITSDLACFRDYIEPGVNADVFETQGAPPEKSLAEVLLRLMTDVERRRSFSRAGLTTAGNFSLSRVADVFVEDFKMLSEQDGAVQ